jgi:peptidoglycan/xylan/chitin deacetylase (PgdA/CDA1 family)
MHKRRLLARLLHDSGALSKVLAVRALTGAPWLSILTYHRFPYGEGHEAFDDGVVDTSAVEFEEQIICLKRHFTLVGVDELCAFAAGGSLPPNALAVTFDDGYLDNYSQALPILRKHGCKAIFFVATSFIAERRLYWWDRVAYQLKQSRRASVELSYPSPFRIELADRAAAITKLLRFIKLRRSLDMPRLLDEVTAATGVAWTREAELEFADRLLMTWDHVRALREAGMDVESHTRTHRVLQTLPEAELQAELEGSRRDLEQQLGVAPRALAYPVGKPVKVGSPIRSALVRAGYKIGLTNGTGPTPTWRRCDPYDIHRQTVGRHLPLPYLLSILALPPLAPKHPWHTSELE